MMKLCSAIDFTKRATTSKNEQKLMFQMLHFAQADDANIFL